MRKQWVRVVLGAGCFIAVGANAAVNAQSWTLVDIGTLGGPGSYGAAVSDSGFVVGCADLASGVSHAFLYDGAMHDLGPGGGDPNGNSCALAVNDRGVAAGRSSSGDLVMWSGSSVTALGVKGTVGAINDSNTIVGAAGAVGAGQAFIYSSGAMTMLGDSATTSEAKAINARGQVAGTLGGRAFLYTAGAMQDLGSLGGFSSAKGIDDAGHVVGMSTDANGTPYPFLWANGSMSVMAGPSGSGAIDIDDSGEVIGSAEGTYGYFLDNGTYLRLDSIPAVAARGWRHLEPTGINNRGWIVGSATDSSGNLRAFLLVPGGRGNMESVQFDMTQPTLRRTTLNR
jgi:probable HAF family extracellular repeat protein